MKIKKMILSALIAALLVPLSVQMISPGGTSAASEYVAMYNKSDAASHNAVQIGATDAYGLQFNALVPFSAIKACCPSWSDNVGTLNFVLYKWNGNYSTTVSGAPIYTKTFINFNDNAWLEINFREQAAGEYLFVIKGGADSAGFWGFNSNYSNIRYFKNGSVATGTMQAEVKFTKTASQYFGSLSSQVSGKTALDYTVDPTQWVAVDGLGRTLPTYSETGAKDGSKFVGMFYWTWHYNFTNNRPININSLIAQYPDARLNYNHEIWASNRADSYFWNEPVYGYYSSTDKYVLRKDAELIANAGVDVIIFDCTNGTFTWQPAYTALLEVYQEARNDGIKTPQIAFMLPFAANSDEVTSITNIYNDIYAKRKYEDLWFYWKGKPLIMAHPYSSIPAEIRNFFTFRKNDPSYFSADTKTVNGVTTWGWLSKYPQTKYYGPNGNVEQMTVGTAQNASALGLTAMNDLRSPVYGRSYSQQANYSYSYKYDGKTIVASSKMDKATFYGINFQEQWDYALSVDPEFIFVTGWNEYIMGRFETWQGVTNAFPDQFNDEYSRDCAVTKGSLKDYYYMQLVANIRKFKGVSQIKKQTEGKTIDITGSVSQWDNIPGSYHYYNNTPNRDTDGWSGTHYTNNTMRNDIILTKVSYDRSNVYFYVQTKDNITTYTGSAWMNLFLDTKIADGKKDHWEEFEYVINRKTPTASKAYLEKSNGGWNWSVVGQVDYKVTGNVLQIAVPRSLIGMTGSSVKFNYKWADNVTTTGDILDLYTNGDVAPGSRFAVAFDSGTNPTYKDGLPEGKDSAGYTVYNSKYTVKGVKRNTTVSALKSHYTSMGYTVSVKNGSQVLADSAVIPTGAVITSGSISYTVIVAGDVDGDGKATANDYAMLKSHFKKKLTLTDRQIEASDMDENGKLTTSDYIAVKRNIVK